MDLLQGFLAMTNQLSSFISANVRIVCFVAIHISSLISGNGLWSGFSRDSEARSNLLVHVVVIGRHEAICWFCAL